MRVVMQWWFDEGYLKPGGAGGFREEVYNDIMGGIL